MIRRQLLIFARSPAAGRVKTRLIPRLGPDGAAALHTAFLTDILRQCQRADRRVVVHRTGDSAHPIWFELASQLDFEIREQPVGDLGVRLRFAVEEAFDAAPDGEGVVVIGCDSPTLPQTFIDSAFAALAEPDSASVVLGPACDGGYYLIGLHPRLRGDLPPVFEDKPWGAGDVLTKTLCTLEASRVRYRLLPFWYDVDRPHDLDLLAAHLPVLHRAGESVPAETQRVVAALLGEHGF